jgi:hypothetical protein
MDKNTLSQYGWVVICIIVIAIMIGLATPFGSFVKQSVDNTIHSFGDKISVVLTGDTETGPRVVAKSGTTGYVDDERMYVYGVPIRSNPLDYFEAAKGGYIEMSQGEAEEGITNGTGSLLTLYEDNTKTKVVAKYTLIIFGDVDRDGIVNIADASAIDNHVYITPITNQASLFAADVTADKNVDMTDSNRICSHVWGEAILPVNVWDTNEVIAKNDTTGFVDNERMYVYGVPENSNPLDYFEATNNGYIEMSRGEAQTNVTNATGSILTLYTDNTKTKVVAEYTLIIFGDIYRDGYIDVTDSNAVSQHANFTSEITNEASLFAADVNADEIIDGVDALEISKHVNGVSQLPTNVWG